MSTDDFDPPEDRSKSDSRSAAIALGTVAVVLLVFYLYVGRDLQQSVKIAEETRVAQQAAEQKIAGNEQVVSNLQSQLHSVRDSFQKTETDLAEAQAMRARLTQIEEALADLPELVHETKSEIDATTMRTARSRGEFVSTLKLIEDVANELERLAKLTYSWQQDFEPLLEDDRGSRLAGDENAVRDFLTAVSAPLPTVQESLTWTAEFNEASRPLREAAKSGATDIQTTAEDQAYFEAMLTRVKTGCDALARRQETVELLLTRTSQRPVSGTTLKEAIKNREQNELQRLLAEAEEKRLEALKAAIAQQSLEIEQAEQARIAAETALRVAEKKAQVQGIRTETQRIDNEIDEAAIAAARKKLEAEFARDEPEIQSLLAPFLAESVTHPNLGNPNDPHTWIIRAGDLVPVSFGRLQSSGSLANTHEGRHRLYYFAGSADSIRPKQGFPAYSRTGLNNPAIVARITRAQDLLIKYGPLMVERGLLYR
jgi:DNA repair exonuclease SbcCD ATPase subunit